MASHLCWFKYYVSSIDFQMEAERFMENYGHNFEPIPGVSDKDGNILFYEWNNPYFCESEIYQKYRNKWNDCQGYPGLYLTCKNRAGKNALNKLTSRFWRPYFTEKKSGEQVFALAFALWWGLYDDQILQIDSANGSQAENVLNYFLCNPEERDLPQDFPSRYLHMGTYLVWHHGDAKNNAVWIADFNPIPEAELTDTMIESKRIK